MVSPSLKNDKLKAEVLRRVFPDGPKVGCHKFSMQSDKCAQCSMKFWDWVVEQPDGSIAVGMLLCSVIGLDEVARFNCD